MEHVDLFYVIQRTARKMRGMVRKEEEDSTWTEKPGPTQRENIMEKVGEFKRPWTMSFIF